jgi:hypothetical protein
MKNASFFPIKIRGKDYLIIQKGNVIEVAYDNDDEASDEEVPDEEANIIIMYLMDEGFVK